MRSGPTIRARRIGFAVAAALAAGLFPLMATAQSVGPANVTLPPAIPVKVGEAVKRDFPIFVRGIGTVQAYNTVSIVSRVDGELVNVAFREGQDVQVGDLLAQIDPRPFEAQLRQSEAARDRDRASLATVKLDFGRSTELLGQGFATRQTYDTQKNQIAQLEAAIRSDDAAIDYANLQLNYSRITSPLAGRTGVRLLDAGNVVRAAAPAPLVLITQLKPISVVFSLPQGLLPEIFAAAKAGGQLPVFAYVQNGQQPVAQGRLEIVDNTIDQPTGSVRLKASFPNDNEELWPGQFVNIRLQLGIKKDSTIIPTPAVQRNQEGTYAWAVKSDGTVEVRPVRIERIEGDEALVAAGLAPGSQIVVDGHSRLRPGSRIEAKAAQAADIASPSRGDSAK